MRLLLDTHVALWSVTDDARLSAHARRLIVEDASAIAVSVASLWEIALKHAAKREGPGAMPIGARDAAAYFAKAGFDRLPASDAHIFALEDLPPIHKDPFDRLILAQARVEGMTLLTADASLARYPGDVRTV